MGAIVHLNPARDCISIAQGFGCPKGRRSGNPGKEDKKYSKLRQEFHVFYLDLYFRQDFDCLDMFWIKSLNQYRVFF